MKMDGSKSVGALLNYLGFTSTGAQVALGTDYLNGKHCLYITVVYVGLDGRLLAGLHKSVQAVRSKMVLQRAL